MRAERIEENFNVFDFELTDEELASITDLDLKIRRGPEPDSIDTTVFSFTIPED